MSLHVILVAHKNPTLRAFIIRPRIHRHHPIVLSICLARIQGLWIHRARAKQALSHKHSVLPIFIEFQIFPRTRQTHSCHGMTVLTLHLSWVTAWKACEFNWDLDVQHADWACRRHYVIATCRDQASNTILGYYIISKSVIILFLNYVPDRSLQ